MISGVGVVISGIMTAGTVNQGDKLQLGPSKNGEFREVLIKGIHVNRKSVETAKAG